jgi:hypothetical protein
VVINVHKIIISETYGSESQIYSPNISGLEELIRKQIGLAWYRQDES